MVGVAGLEPASRASRALKFSQLTYTPIVGDGNRTRVPRHRVPLSKYTVPS